MLPSHNDLGVSRRPRCSAGGDAPTTRCGVAANTIGRAKAKDRQSLSVIMLSVGFCPAPEGPRHYPSLSWRCHREPAQETMCSECAGNCEAKCQRLNRMQDVVHHAVLADSCRRDLDRVA
jgi:hypothetical protein